MSGRPTREAVLAVALVQRTGCTPLAAARRYGLHVSTVRRALAKIGQARPVGRPKKTLRNGA